MMKHLIDFLSVLLNEIDVQGRTGTWDSYLATYKSILAFSGNRSITMEEVFNKAFLHQYQTYLLNKGCCYNTISSYMRVLRAIRNKAEKRKLLVTEADLFDRLYTGSESTMKRAISAEAILKINDADLSKQQHLEKSRDLFMLSFHLQGMSFIDLAHLRKSNLVGEYLIYHRRKTGSKITIQLLPEASRLITCYLNKDSESPYLLSILTTTGDDPTKEYRTILRRYNRHLKVLAATLQMTENLTSYVARHSWATAAYYLGAPTTMISEALGHSTEEVTRTYLAGFQHEKLACVNRMVSEALFGNKMSRKNKRSINNCRQTSSFQNVSLFIGDGHQS